MVLTALALRPPCLPEHPSSSPGQEPLGMVFQLPVQEVRVVPASVQVISHLGIPSPPVTIMAEHVFFFLLRSFSFPFGRVNFGSSLFLL
jgi:hypothetical protein